MERRCSLSSGGGKSTFIQACEWCVPLVGECARCPGSLAGGHLSNGSITYVDELAEGGDDSASKLQFGVWFRGRINEGR